MIWQPSDPDIEDVFPICLSCDRAHFQVNEDGLCVTCDMIVRAQVKTGLQDLDTYMGKVTLFQRWLREHPVAA